MPTVTRSAHKAPAKPHKPKFPIRKPALVKAAEAQTVTPINATRVKAHYTRHGGKIMWGIMALCAMMGVFFSQQILAAYEWVRLESNERTFAELGRDTCKQPLLTAPEYTCTAGELDCFTIPQEAVIKRYEQQARERNLWQAENCIPLIP